MTAKGHEFRLSVLLVTYNQEQYVSDALQSLFGQTIDGPIQLVVADDGSTDGTVEIISEWDGRDSRFHFTYLNHSSNRGITRNYQRGFAACAGDYVATLEGDDYWTSPSKLQRQVDFLESHWECDMCAVNYFIYREARAEFTPRTPVGQGYRYLSARDQIADNLASNFSTCMYRRSALEALPAGLFETTSYDWIVNICVGRRSLIGFLEEPMSVYRLHEGGIWTRTSSLEQYRAQLDLIPSYDALTDNLFAEEFAALADRLRSAILEARLATAPHAGPRSSRDPRALAFASLTDHLPPEVVALARMLLPRAVKRAVVIMFHLDQS